jgi:hypothetical protein
MALGSTYVSINELKAYLQIGPDKFANDERLVLALDASSRAVERCCHRQFNQAGSATARLYEPASPYRVSVDDFHTTTDLVVEVDETGTGSYDRVWSAADYELSPVNGIVDGQPGWPYSSIEAVGSYLFPRVLGRRRSVVRVTADWGWSEIPGPVKQATLLLAAQAYKLAEAPLGVAGFGEFGVVRVHENKHANSLLTPYVRDRVLVY